MTLAAAVLVALAVGLGGRRSRRRVRPVAAPDERRRLRPARVADAALATDLLASCLAAGATPTVALRAAASAVPAATALSAVADRLQRGDSGSEAWSPARADPDLRDVARTCARAGASGAAVASELRRIARRMRTRRAIEARRRVQRASVWIVLPLGLCFLPAFVLVGIVPLVASIVPQLLA